MNEEININDFFSEHIECFTIYVVEQKFALNQGREYFRQFSSKENYINSNDKINTHLSKILKWIHKRIPNVADLTKSIISMKTVPSSSGIVDVVMSLNKLFTITEHQAVGPEVIDPIIYRRN